MKAKNYKLQKFGNITWFSNLSTDKQKIILDTGVTYEQGVANGWYQKYDNYDAINVNKISQIPMDYNGIMGVPITFIDKHNPEQFEIIGLATGNSRACGFYGATSYTPHPDDRGGCPILNGKRVYSRLLIKRK